MKSQQQARELVERLVEGEVNCLVYTGGKVTDATHKTGAIFPGAFNPLHAAHRKMAAIAEQTLGCHVSYELSIHNVDKRPIAVETVLDRLIQFNDRDVCLTCAATFREKSQVFRHPQFIVGADTIQRIADPRYYDNDLARRDEAIAELTRGSAKFLVFGRAVGNCFQLLGDLDLPSQLAALCQSVEETTFRMDISSTELRDSMP